MWIRYTKETGPNKVGSFADVDETTQRMFVNLGIAEVAPEDPVQRAISQASSTFQAVLDAHLVANPPVRQTPARTAPRGIVPPDRGAVEFTSIRGGEAEADRRRNVSGFVRNIVLAHPLNPDPAQRDAAHEELVRPWEEGGFGSHYRAMVEGTGTAGGYATPVIYETRIMEFMAESQVIIPGATEMPMAAREVLYPVVNQYSIPVNGQTAMFGGIKVYRKGEITQRTESDVSFKKLGMLANDMTAYTELSRDLLQDAPGLDNYVMRAMGGALGWREDWESIT